MKGHSTWAGLAGLKPGGKLDPDALDVVWAGGTRPASRQGGSHG